MRQIVFFQCKHNNCLNLVRACINIKTTRKKLYIIGNITYYNLNLHLWTANVCYQMHSGWMFRQPTVINLVITMVSYNATEITLKDKKQNKLLLFIWKNVVDFCCMYETIGSGTSLKLLTLFDTHVPIFR